MTRRPQTTFAIAALFLALSPCATCVSKAQTPAKRPMTFADLMAMKRIADPQISPSGKWVLFSLTDVSLAANTKISHLWIVPLLASQLVPNDGAKPETQLTTGKGESNGRFAPDGKHISYTADDSSGTSQIFLAEWNEAEATLTTATQFTHLATGADGAIWSPDSQHLLFTSSVYPECSAKEGVLAAKSELASPEPYLGDRFAHPAGTALTPAKSGTISPMVTAGLSPAAWPDEESCNTAKEEAATRNPVKAQIWDSLLYRHWNQFTGEKRSHILVVAATNGNDIHDLTPASNVGTAETPTFSLGGPLGYAWSPDSKEIAYVTNLDAVPATSTNNDIFTLNVTDANAKPQKISTSPGSDDGPQYSPDGKYIAFRSQARNGFESDRFRLMLYNRTDKSTRELVPKFDRWIDEFTWAPQSEMLDSIFFTAGVRGEENLYSINFHQPATAAERDNLAEISRLTRSLESAQPRKWKAGEVAVQWTQNSEIGSPVLGTLPPIKGGFRANGNLAIIAVSMKVDRPAEIVQVHPSDAGVADVPDTLGVFHAERNLQSILVTHVNKAVLGELDLGGMESFDFPGANNTQVQGFLIRPPNFDPDKKYPLKFLIHGGPQGAWGDSWSYRWNPELMAASGYVVVMINPRGSTGYGQKFIDEVSGDWGGRAYKDLMLGLDYAEQHFPFIDKTRECALGASYGGYMADWILTHTDRFKCIVTHDGMSDPASAFGTTEELWFAQWEFRPLAASPGTKNSASTKPGTPSSRTASPSVRLGSQNADDAAHATVEQTKPAYPWDFYDKPATQDPFRRWSPMLSIQNAKTPTLIIHGQRDYRLDVSQGLELFTALQLRGIPSKMLYFPDEGHWVLKPQNSQLWNETVGDWCDRWTHTNDYTNPATSR